MKKIIIVDDSATMRNQVRQAVAAAGLEIVEAVDGQDGLEKIDSDAGIGIMILDVNMPRMNGLELAEALKASGRIASGLAIMMLTTEGQTELVKRAREVGVKGWMVKPFKPEMLLAAVKKLAAA